MRKKYKRNYNEEQKSALELVLDMGFRLENSNGDVIKSIYGTYEINFYNGNLKEYEMLEKALDAFFKKH
mgnify:CR=1 FL=1